MTSFKHLTKFFSAFGLACTALVAPYPPAFCQLPDEVSSTPVKDKWALVIGISEFKNPSLNLKYAAKDAGDFKDFLVSKCHFAPDHVKLLVNSNANKNRILDLIGDSWLPRVVLPDDLVVIFISSHGSPSEMDVCGVNYVVAHDTNPDKLFTTGIQIQQLANTIRERVHSNRVLVILDACHSGGASEGGKGIQRMSNVDATQVAQGTGHMVICSSSKTEASWESKKYPNGVFTHTLIEALQKNGDKTTLTDAFASLKEGVQSQVAAERGVMQTPVLEMSKWKGKDILLAAVPSSPRKPLIDPDTIANDDEDSTQSLAASQTASAQSMQSQTLGSGNGGASARSSANSKEFIPEIKGEFLGTNNLTYKYWQKGRSCGWEMPQFFESGKCTISDDGKTLASSWSGPIVGSGIFNLECDSNGRVVKITATDGSFSASRIGQ